MFYCNSSTANADVLRNSEFRRNSLLVVGAQVIFKITTQDVQGSLRWKCRCSLTPVAINENVILGLHGIEVYRRSKPMITCKVRNITELKVWFDKRYKFINNKRIFMLTSAVELSLHEGDGSLRGEEESPLFRCRSRTSSAICRPILLASTCELIRLVISLLPRLPLLADI